MSGVSAHISMNYQIVHIQNCIQHLVAMAKVYDLSSGDNLECMLFVCSVMVELGLNIIISMKNYMFLHNLIHFRGPTHNRQLLPHFYNVFIYNSTPMLKRA